MHRMLTSYNLYLCFFPKDGVVGSEDCLWLSVFTPGLPGDDANAKKPVLVWIHGGRGLVGAARTQNYSPK